MKVLTLAAVLLIAANVSFAQPYTNSPSDSIVSTTGMDMLKVATISQLHTGADTLHLAWRKLSASFPAGWEISLCDYPHCYTTIPDSGNMDPVVPGDIGVMSLHVIPHISYGTAIVRCTLWDIGAASIKDTLTWVISCNSTGTKVLTNTLAGIYANNKAIYINSRSSGSCNILITDLVGRVVYNHPVISDTEHFDVSFFNDGIYIITLLGEHIFMRQKVLLSNQ